MFWCSEPDGHPGTKGFNTQFFQALEVPFPCSGVEFLVPIGDGQMDFEGFDFPPVAVLIFFVIRLARFKDGLGVLGMFD